MDELERRLKDDAEDIRPGISAAFAARLDASLQAAEPAAAQETRSRGRGISGWWVSGLTGAVGALLVLVVLNRNAPPEVAAPAELPVARTVPETGPQAATGFPLQVESAEFTEPLQDELEKLRSDLEKARQAVETDLRRSF